MVWQFNNIKAEEFFATIESGFEVIQITLSLYCLASKTIFETEAVLPEPEPTINRSLELVLGIFESVKNQYDKIIFMGDYVDDFNLSDNIIIKNNIKNYSIFYKELFRLCATI